jgi:branched-chain amino acid transport system ATP-binding protein
MSLGLAPLLVQQLMGIVLELVAKGLTVLCVEQNTQLILRHAQHAYVLQNGRVASEGSGAELLQSESLHDAYFSAEEDLE